MSPEQVCGQAVDHRSDIFSFGAVLYEMRSGLRAFQADQGMGRGRPRLLSLGLAGALVFAATGLAFWLGRWGAPPAVPPFFERLTFRVSRVDSAQFAPDGEAIVYGAEWGTSPSEPFSTQATTRESRSLGLREAAILAISSRARRWRSCSGPGS